jgi:hypothetical protein
MEAESSGGRPEPAHLEPDADWPGKELGVTFTVTFP